MNKNYFYIILMFFLFSAGISAQETKYTASPVATEAIEGLNIYPNPVNSGRVFITSKLAQTKEVEIFDVLGKRVLMATLSGKELNISDLTAGVYIIKIKEGDASATRKLIVR
ncbi:T9SS type A sorting domain-containing protein [Flavobacterium rhizosphaerae]|uniref:T9SS type A sorting domain-containing protein n=1 Tax=Flavobacterium rhizosphaerae TaxID=3163298 RepID=A0ABW8YW60_9FLAO